VSSFDNRVVIIVCRKHRKRERCAMLEIRKTRFKLEIRFKLSLDATVFEEGRERCRIEVNIAVELNRLGRMSWHIQ
jgi:hypothetical protein